MKLNPFFGMHNKKRYNAMRDAMLFAFEDQNFHTTFSLSKAMGLSGSAIENVIKYPVEKQKNSALRNVFFDLLNNGILKKHEITKPSGRIQIKYYIHPSAVQPDYSQGGLVPKGTVVSVGTSSDYDKLLNEAEELFTQLKIKLVEVAKLEVKEKIKALEEDIAFKSKELAYVHGKLEEQKKTQEEEKQAPMLKKLFSFRNTSED